MIFGSVSVSGNAVETHRDSYLLAQLTVASVRRPFLAGAILFAGAGAAFSASFIDLLYAGEVITISIASVLILFLGWWLGQLRLLSRDLRGTELSGVVWGSYRHLNRVRFGIVSAMHEAGFPQA